MAIANRLGSVMKLTVVGPSICRRKSLQGNCLTRRHSWACDEACEDNILESEKVATALTLLERLSASATLMVQPEKDGTCVTALGSEENHSTSGGSGPEDERSSAADDDELQPAEGDVTLWPDTDSDDGFCSAWDIRRGSLSSEYGSDGTMPLSAEVADENCHPEDVSIHDALSPSPTPEPEFSRTPIKCRNGVVIDDLTTLMIRNLPTSLQQDQLIVELGKAGFEGLYDFCHLPVVTASGTRKGYAFVNMIDTASAEKLSAAWHKTRQTCLGMKPDDQALDIVAANVQGFEANVAMVNEPKKRRGAKSGRSAKALARQTRGRSSSRKATAPKVIAKAPTVPPGTFHDMSPPAATPGSPPPTAAAVGPCARSDAMVAVAPAGDVVQSKVLSMLGLAEAPRNPMPWTAPINSSSKACASVAASPLVLSVPAPGSGASRPVPR